MKVDTQKAVTKITVEFDEAEAQALREYLAGADLGVSSSVLNLLANLNDAFDCEQVLRTNRPFSEGDKVRVTRDEPFYRDDEGWRRRVEFIYKDDVGTIESGPDSEGDFRVFFGGGPSSNYIAPECLERVGE